MKIDKRILKNDRFLDKVMENICDYPLYINRSNISRCEAYAINEILHSQIAGSNDTEFEIIIKTK